ncbi:MAG: hypothetical protein CVV49_10200 [Spirochaetae bacterium HGW-Spirochaetae-5]|nr:MAG: hypothetical protein CVV49_10200 [Spirochaetae bacterium HGW-Spirochaetae-5]
MAARPGDLKNFKHFLFSFKLPVLKTRNPPVSLCSTSPFVKGGYKTLEVKTLFIKEGGRQAGRFENFKTL